MTFDYGDAADGFAEASERLLSELSLFGLDNLNPKIASAYTELNNALSDYQELVAETQSA